MIKRIIINNRKKYIVNVPTWDVPIVGAGDDYGIYPGTSSLTSSGNVSITSLTLVNQTDYGSGTVFGFDRYLMSGSRYLFASDGINLTVFDTIDPLNLVQIGQLTWPSSNVESMTISGNYIYAFQVDANLYTVDISDITTPNIVATFSIIDGVNVLAYYPWHWCFIEGNLLYGQGHYGGGGAGDAGSCLILDISDPLNISYASVLHHDFGGEASPGGGDMCKVGDYLYFGDYFYSSYFSWPGRVLIADVSDPYNASVVGQFFDPDPGDPGPGFPQMDPWRIISKDNILYVLDDFVIQCWDLTDPLVPVRVKSVYGGADTEGAIITNKIMFNIINDGKVLEAYTLNDASDPVLEQSLILSAGGSNITDFDDRNYLYGAIGGKLAIFHYTFTTS